MIGKVGSNGRRFVLALDGVDHDFHVRLVDVEVEVFGDFPVALGVVERQRRQIRLNLSVIGA